MGRQTNVALSRKPCNWNQESCIHSGSDDKKRRHGSISSPTKLTSHKVMVLFGRTMFHEEGPSLLAKPSLLTIKVKYISRL